jgi:hypothetical protein
MRLFTILILAIPLVANAEPFLAVQNGYQCGQCHINPTGGGMRNSFGAVFSRTLLPSQTSAMDDRFAALTGDVLGLGVDLRETARQRQISGQDTNLDFGTDRITAYLTAKPVESVRLYLDEQVAPGGSITRESWAQFTFRDFYVKAGKFFLPYGLRIEDDSAYIRQFTGINFNTADNGVEVGHVGDHWSAQVSITNGTSGGAEIDDGKQISARVAWLDRNYRVGISASDNDTDGTDRTLYGLFAGLRTGDVGWLAEYDRAHDVTAGLADADTDIGLVEADWYLRRGNYLRFIVEIQSSPTNTLPDSNRYSIEYLWFPVPLTEVRFVARANDSDDPDPFLNAEEYFLQVHVYF